MKTIFVFLTITVFILSSCKDERKHSGLKPLSLTSVKVLGEMGGRIDITIENNLKAIDIRNQFLKHFQNRKDTPDLRDGFCGIGILLDGVVKLAAYSRDPQMIRLKEKITDELIKTQSPDGYIGVYTDAMRKTGWDTHEGSYIITALVSDYNYFNNKHPLDAAEDLADYMIRSGDGYVCGFEYALISLFKATGKRKYLDYCINNLGLPAFRGGSEHHSTHVYGYLARVWAQLELYKIKPDPILLVKSKSAVEGMTTFDEMDITGTIGMWEHWDGSHEGTGACGETCASAYALRLLDDLMQVEKNPVYGDIMERIIYNALFAAQSPDGRKIRYFTPFEGQRSYYPDDYFCCPGNYRRIIAGLPEFIYYVSHEGIYVNLFTGSEAGLSLDNDSVHIAQSTFYPSDGTVIITVETAKPKRFTLFIRIPVWCNKAAVQVDGRPSTQKANPGTFMEIKREWTGTDTILLNMPLDWRFIKGRKRQYRKAALMRGPVVYCLGSERNRGLFHEKTKREVTLDPRSLSGVKPDSAYRPGGTMCTANITEIGGQTSGVRNKPVFTEFIDPSGEMTYFSLPQSLYDSVTVDDEIYCFINQQEMNGFSYP